MSLELVDASVSAVDAKVGSDQFSVAGGQRLTIETSPGGAEILDIEVPVGQTWQVSINLRIIVN